MKYIKYNLTYSRKSDRREDFVHPAEPYPGESFYTLKLRNTNLLGPTGMYLIPSMNPWICTVNSWYIEVEGEMVNFLIFDADNVCHPNPMFGHEWQVYQRGKEKIRDPATGEIIGFNTPITFSFSTGTFIAVPGGKIKGVGDKPTLQAVSKLKFPRKRSPIKPLNQELRLKIFKFWTFGTA